jgi:hypothetical protein
MGANAFGLGPFGGLQGLNNMGLGNNFTEIQQRMQREVIYLQLVMNLFLIIVVLIHR